MKIVFIGAGSRDFGRGQIVDLLHSKELQGRNVTLSLVDQNETALETMTRLAERIKEHTGSDFTIESTTDRTKALPNADYVITAVARKRMELWEQDFRIPLSYGFKHCLGENGGPGALFHALRSFELIIPICRDIETYCPNALLLNFTNPEARVLHAILNLTKVNAVGLCHGVFSGLRAVSEILERPLDELEIISAGMNHFYCMLQVKDKQNGQDLLPTLLEKAKDSSVLSRLSRPHLTLFREMVEIFGMFTYPTDDHIGEYLSFGAEFAGGKWKYGQESRQVTLHTPVQDQHLLADYASGKRELDQWILRSSSESTVPIICDIELNRGMMRPAVNVLNTGLYIENLHPNGVVEVPAIVDAKGVHPVKVGRLSEPIAAMINLQYAIHNLLTEAYQTKSRELLLQALLLDPVVNSITAAKKMLTEMLELQREFIPSFFE